MFQNIHVRRIAATALLGVMALGAFAPAADAGGRGKEKRWKNDRGYRSEYRSRGNSARRYADRHYPIRREYRHKSRDRHRHYSRDRVVYRDRGSDLGPALVGFVGGLIVGSAVSNHGHAHAGARYAYYDPYCERSYATLHAGVGHFRGCDHPRVIRQVEVRTKRVVKTYHYENSGWSSCGHDAGYHDDYYDDDYAYYDE